MNSVEREVPSIHSTIQVARLDCSAVFHHDGVLIGDFRKAWKSALVIAGVGEKLVHDFRRTAVRNLMRAGNPENDRNDANWA